MFNFFKKKKIWGIYSDHLYSGLSGILMKYCHKKLENSLPKRKYDNILEIGPGPHSHYQYIKHPFKKYYILEANEEVFKRYKKNKNIIAKFQVKKNLPFKRNYFDRIILSHVLEHVIEPSKFIEKLFKSSCLIWTGETRSASSILKKQEQNAKNNFDNLKSLTDLTMQFKKELNSKSPNLKVLGSIIRNGWEIKQLLSTYVNTLESQKIMDELEKRGVV
jgi:hypothetical protein